MLRYSSIQISYVTNHYLYWRAPKENVKRQET